MSPTFVIVPPDPSGIVTFPFTSSSVIGVPSGTVIFSPVGSYLSASGVFVNVPSTSFTSFTNPGILGIVDGFSTLSFIVFNFSITSSLLS